MGTTGIINGAGHWVFLEDAERGPSGGIRLADGLYVFPNPSRKDRFVWEEEDSGFYLYKPEFKQADEALGYKGYQGGPAFLALAKHFAGRRYSFEVRADLLEENYKRGGEFTYALAQQAVAETLKLAQDGELYVVGLMSERRMNVVRAVLGGVVELSVDGALPESEVANITLDMEAEGYEVERVSVEPNRSGVYHALDRTRIATIAGAAVIKIGHGLMRQLNSGDQAHIEAHDAMEFLTLDKGWEYLRATAVS